MTASINILVVDDEDVFRNNLLRILHMKGYNAQGAANGFDALKILSGSSTFHVELT